MARIESCIHAQTLTVQSEKEAYYKGPLVKWFKVVCVHCPAFTNQPYEQPLTPPPFVYVKGA
jgi:hypothetical protein